MAHANLIFSLDGWDIKSEGNVKRLYSPFSKMWITVSPQMSQQWDLLYQNGFFGPRRDPRYLYANGHHYARYVYDAIQHQRDVAAGIVDMEDMGSEDTEVYIPDPRPPAREHETVTFIVEDPEPEPSETPSPAGDDLDTADGDGLVAEAEAEMASDPDNDGLERSPMEPDFTPSPDTNSQRNTGAAANVLNDPYYHQVVLGWNEKLAASSEKMSGLTPFCELYAIFSEGDLVFEEQGNRYTAIKDRLIPVRFGGVMGEPPLPDGIKKDSKIAKIAGDNVSQLQPDSVLADEYGTSATKSYKGVPGINDLAVSRGSSAAQNVKYDLSITLPNPELINERFEYSKLMLMNSAFLLIYGWNTRDSDFTASAHYPPVLNNPNGSVNEVLVGDGLGGFWSSAIINLSNFQFNFDNVGHLIGKLTFLNSNGIFLGTLETEAVGNTMLDALTTPAKSVLNRVGGKDNQNYIWENGVPWAALPADEDLAKDLNDQAARNSIIREYFNNDSSSWSTATEEVFEDIYTVEQALDLKNRISEVKEMGEKFLEGYRGALLRSMLQRAGEKDGNNQYTEVSRGQTEKDNYAAIKEAGYNFNSDPAELEGLDSMVPLGTLVTAAWNTYFGTRFAGIHSGGGSDLDRINRNTAGTAFKNFPVFGDIPPTGTIPYTPIRPEWMGDYNHFLNLVKDDITFQFRPYGRGIVAPIRYKELLADPAAAISDYETSIVGSMPPFGVDLQRKIADSFRDPSNINHINFYGANRSSIIVPNVIELIERTSVISAPVTVDAEDALIMTPEKRTFSEIMETAPNDVMIEFQLLDTRAVSDESFSSDLWKIIFHSTDVLVALQDPAIAQDGIVDLATSYLSNFENNAVMVDDPSWRLGDSLITLHLEEVMGPINALERGRFVQWRHAITKKGWVVSQFAETINKPLADIKEPKPLVQPGSSEPTGLSFLMGLFPSDVQARVEPFDIDYYTELQELSEKVMGEDRVPLEDRQEKVDRLDNISWLTSIILATQRASFGSQTLERRDVGSFQTEQIAIADETGNSIQHIFRQPIYFFLGSVLESLRITTNNKVKFYYSEIPQSKLAKPFFIDLPEHTGTGLQNIYDSQIADLERQLKEWQVTVVDPTSTEDEIRLVNREDVTPPTTADNLAKAQADWDAQLAKYVLGRGIHFAGLGYHERNVFPGDWPVRPGIDETIREDFMRDVNQGFYSSYTNLAGNQKNMMPRPSNYKWSDSDRNNGNYVWYKSKDMYGGEINPTGRYNVVLPWIYRIGAPDVTGFYPRDQHPWGNNYEWAPNPAGLSGTIDGPGGHIGFMRMWRPEDLDAIIGALARDIPIYYRELDDDNSTAGGYVSFYTDSFGTRNAVGYAQDWGIHTAFNNEGLLRRRWGERADPGSKYEVKQHENNRSTIAHRIMGWLNWVPADSATRARYSYLGTGVHLNYGGAGSGPSSWESPTFLSDEERIDDGWLRLKWSNTRPGSPSEENFWIRGEVTRDFLELEGMRPTEDNPQPQAGEDEQISNLRNIEIAALRREIEHLRDLKSQNDLTAQYKNLPIRSTFEIPVNIQTIRHFLTSEPRAPLHKLLKKILAATKETSPAVQLSMRPAAGDPNCIDVFPSAVNYDGVIQEVFTELDVNRTAGTMEAGDEMGIVSARKSLQYGGLVKSEKVIVCQFGTSHSLIENFGLSSKIDPTAFSAFRLPAVVGGASMNVLDIIRSSQKEDGAFESLLNDFSEIIEGGVTKGIEGLKKLKIVTEDEQGNISVDRIGLASLFVNEDAPVISKAASSLVEDLMSQNVSLYNKILLMQNEFFTGLEESQEGTIGNPDKNTRFAGSKFYGNVLSTFLRTATLTIHGTTGLNVFNLIYLKGLVSGVEGLYLISSVNESIAASTFTTTLECKLIEYVNNNPQTNPMAYRGRADLNRIASIIDEAKEKDNHQYGIDFDLEDLDTFIFETDREAGWLQG